MGHQESWIYCDDFKWLLNKVKELGKEYFDNKWLSVCEIVTLDKRLSFNLGAMCHPEIKRRFTKGTKFLWISGDRQYQRRLFGERSLFENHIPEDKNVEFYYIECFLDKVIDFNFEAGDRRGWKFQFEEFKFE